MDKEQAIILARRFKNLILDFLPLRALYLYGSHSKGSFNENSDIDIAVIVDNLNDDYFNVPPLLWKLRRKVSTLIEPVSLNADERDPLCSYIVKSSVLYD